MTFRSLAFCLLQFQISHFLSSLDLVPRKVRGVCTVGIGTMFILAAAYDGVAQPMPDPEMIQVQNMQKDEAERQEKTFNIKDRVSLTNI